MGFRKVKVNYNNGEEIRLFQLDLHPPQGKDVYPCLLEHVSKIFELEEETTFKINWKDDENELITISCQFELDDALDNAAGSSPLKLFVFTESRQNDLCFPSHPGIQCNICNFLVTGTRFNCLECEDFDLCQSCHSKGEHYHHTLLLQRRPSQLTNLATRRGSPGFNRGSKRRFLQATGPSCLPLQSFTDCPESLSMVNPEEMPENSIEEALRVALSRMGISDANIASSRPPTDAMETSITPAPANEEMASGEFVVIPERVPSGPIATYDSLGHLPQHIRAAREKMLAMGFTDSNGWLTTLVVREDGDIHKCLDIIQRKTNKR